MHSFHHSRGRILFEVFCALVVAASCAGAWMQTGAWALLPAALAALLYGLTHIFDLAGRKPAVVAEPQRIDFSIDGQGDLLAYQDASVPLTEADQQLATGDVVEDAKLVEPAAPLASGVRRAKAPRKSGRRASAPKEAKVIERVLPEELDVAVPTPPEEEEVGVPAPPEEAEVDVPPSPEAVVHAPLAPLFEPEPFVRQHRAVFGRRAG